MISSNRVHSVLHYMSGSGSGVWSIIRKESAKANPFTHVGRVAHSFGQGFHYGNKTRQIDFKMRSKMPGILLDLFKGKRVVERVLGSKDFKQIKDHFKQTGAGKDFKESDLGIRFKKFRKTGDVRTKSAILAHQRAKANGLHGIKALTTGNVNKTYLRQRSHQHATALSSSKEKTAEAPSVN